MQFYVQIPDYVCYQWKQIETLILYRVLPPYKNSKLGSLRFKIRPWPYTYILIMMWFNNKWVRMYWEGDEIK